MRVLPFTKVEQLHYSSLTPLTTSPIKFQKYIIQTEHRTYTMFITILGINVNLIANKNIRSETIHVQRGGL